MNGVISVRINQAAASLVIKYDAGLEFNPQLENMLTNIPPEVFFSEPGLTLEVSGQEVAIKAAATALSLLTPKPIKMTISLLMASNVILKGLETFINRGLKVETLDALAVTISLCRGGYFTANSIVTLLALGAYLENNCENRSVNLLKSLLKAPVKQLRVQRDGLEIKIDANDVRSGDRVVFGSGDLITVDGKIIEGEALVNQSSISGESAPVHFEFGDEVASGGLVSEGRLVVQALRIGSETSMAKINKYIDQALRAQSKKQTRSAELADKLVPVTMLLGLLSYLTTRDLRKMASVLTVDFSCAIKLVSPMAARASMYVAGQQGLIIKGASALDALAETNALIFDKTGTLTSGKMTVTDVICLAGIEEDELLAVSASAEELYDHPFARAVINKAKSKKLTIPPTSRVDFIVAHGVSAYIEERHVLVGSRHFIADDKKINCLRADDQAASLVEQGKSLLYVAFDEQLVGIIALIDKPRPEASTVLQKLKDGGIKKIVVLTGDSRQAALALKKQLPQIDEIYSELHPEEKAIHINQLKNEGYFPAYVGDGVNDAPALVNAQVGICMSHGADIAKESAQVILLSDSIEALPTARAIAVRAEKVIRNSFSSTIAFNAAITFLAGTGYLPPTGAALLHNLSTVGILSYASAASSRRWQGS